MRIASILQTLLLTTLACAKLVIQSWKQDISLYDQTPLYKSEISILNNGDNNLNEIQIAFPVERADLIGFYQAEDGFGATLTTVLAEDITVLRVNEEDKEFKFITIKFVEPLTSQRELSIIMKVNFYGKYEFMPSEINLFEDQKVIYNAHIVPTTPYAINDLEVNIELRNQKDKLVIQRDYVDPFSYEEKKYQFVMNRHFLQMRSSKRHIEISHWGNVHFKETYDMMNRAARLIGHFSTLDFNKRNKQVGRNAFKQADFELPYSAWGLEYKDELGNISTSFVRKDEYRQKVLISLTPRYALQGSWNSTWMIGYNIPAKEILKQSVDGSHYMLEYPLSQSIREGNSDEYTLEIALPEGSTVIDVDTGNFKPSSQDLGKSFGYLDLIGRPTIILKFKNHIPTADDSYLRVKYSVSTRKIMMEPLYLVGGFFSLFALSIVIRRMNLDFKEE